MKTNRKVKYTAPNLRIDAILIAFTCMIAVAHITPIFDNAITQPIVNPSK